MICFVGAHRLASGSLLSVGALMLCMSCGSNSTAPCPNPAAASPASFENLEVSCSTTGLELQCTATALSAPTRGTCPTQLDVSQNATFIAGDGNIIGLVRPGVFTALTTGHTIVRATWQGLDSNNYANAAVAVFPGTPPFPTYEIDGTISQAGATPASGLI